MNPNIKISTLILDVDGTLYRFPSGSFSTSELRKAVLKNAQKYISEKLEVSEKQAQKLLDDIAQTDGENISTALEKRHGVDRYDYFNTVWDLPAEQFVKVDPAVAQTLRALSKSYQIILLSDAPMVWMKKIVSLLGASDLISEHNMYSGESDTRKIFGNAFTSIIKKNNLAAQECVAVGDQETTDISPARQIGMKTVRVSLEPNGTLADATIASITQLPDVLPRLSAS